MLRRVREGMTVYDRAGDAVGTVKAVYFGAAEDVVAGDQAPATVTEQPVSTHPIVDALARSLGRTELPEEVRERLLHQGFVHVDIGMAPDRIALTEQIAAVGSDVRLGVGRDELISG